MGLLFVSCETNEITPTQSTKNEGSTSQRVSDIIAGVESTVINNGLEETGCENNILIFPSWEKYWQTIEDLDQMTEQYCDDFDANVPAGITDDQYDVLCQNAGFDEDDMLRKFEDNLKFCSLRQKIENDEAIWLDAQGDGAWDPNADPDNDFIDDETERALLSTGHEVIIGTRKKGYVIYKLFDDEGNYVAISNMDANALQQINNGVIPTNNPNVVVSIPPRIKPACKDKVKQVTYEASGDNRLKRISKIRREFGASYSSTASVSTAIFKSKVKVKTKGYKKKNGKWKCRRTWITAGISGQEPFSSGDGFDTCEAPISIQKTKEKRRRKVKVKQTVDPFVGVLSDLHYFTVDDNKLFSLHKQGGLLINKDFYDMPVD